MTEARLRKSLSDLDGLTERVKSDVDKNLYRGLSPVENTFFELVTVTGENGQEFKMFRGLLVAWVKAFKRNQKTLLGATKIGVSTARGIQREISEGAPKDGPSA